MQLKEFSLISPVIESGTVLKALETGIPSDDIEQAIARSAVPKGQSLTRKQVKIVNVPYHLQNSYLSDNWHELVVKSLNENSPQKSG
jgi:hypothetical protein